MTIDELLQAAAEACQSALAVMDTEDPMECATVAQACAHTAQAMILAQAAPADAMDMARVFMVDTGN